MSLNYNRARKRQAKRKIMKGRHAQIPVSQMSASPVRSYIKGSLDASMLAALLGVSFKRRGR